MRKLLAAGAALVALAALDAATTEPPAGLGQAREVAREAGLRLSVDGDGSPGIFFEIVDAPRAAFAASDGPMAYCLPGTSRCKIEVQVPGNTCHQEALAGCFSPDIDGSARLGPALSRALVELHELGHAFGGSSEHYADAFAACELMRTADDLTAMAAALEKLAAAREAWAEDAHRTESAIRAAVAVAPAASWRECAGRASKLATRK